MSSVSKISSGAVVVPLVRRLPAPVAGVDINFCRNPACAFYGVLPDPFKRPNGSPSAPPGVPRGAVPGGRHKEFYKSCLPHNLPGEEQPRGRRGARATAPPA